MKIAFIGQKGIPVIYGGVERHVHELSVRLAQLGNEVTVYTRGYYTNPKLKRYKKVRLISLPSIRSKNFDAISHVFLATLHAMTKKYDIIHYHGVGPSLLSFIPYLLKPNVKIITTIHAQDKIWSKWSAFAKVFLAFGEWTATHMCDATIVISKPLLEYFKKKYPSRDIIYIPNGIDPKNTLTKKGISSILSNYGLSRNAYVLTVGRFIFDKGIHYLCQTWNRLQSNNKKMKLVIVGEINRKESYTRFLQQISRKNPNIIFTGLQSGKHLEALFRGAYMYVHPSRHEGMPFTILEALGYKKCVLASDISQNREIMESVGFNFKNGNVNDLQKKVEYLLSHPSQVEESAKKSRNYVIQWFHWDNVVHDVVDMYQRLTKKQSLTKKIDKPI